MRKPRWTEQEKLFVNQNVGKMPIPQIAREINRSVNSVNIQILRIRADVKRGGLKKDRVSKNIFREMIATKINPDFFQPTRKFLNSTGIGQKRFYQLLRGERHMTNTEYIKVAQALEITLSDAFELKQLKLDI